MTFILPTNVLGIQNEMKDYRKLCTQYNYTPAQKEYEEIVRFLLLFSGDGINESNANENSSFDYLYESFIEDLNEAHSSTNGEAEFDTAVGVAAAGVGTVAAGAVFAAKSIGDWISYLFKKGKVKKSADAEYNTAQEILDAYTQIYELKLKIAELEGREAPSSDFPGYPS